jgi:hypothetical protein
VEMVLWFPARLPFEKVSESVRKMHKFLR